MPCPPGSLLVLKPYNTRVVPTWGMRPGVVESRLWCQGPTPSALSVWEHLILLPGMPFPSLPATRVNYDSSFGSLLKCHFQGRLP